MDRPIRGVGLGGVRAGVGAVCQTVADHLATGRRLEPRVWIERGERLRCVAGTGAWPARDTISAVDGVVGMTFTTGVETVIADLAAHAQGDAAPVAAAQACVPIRCEGTVVGVLEVRLAESLRAGDLERARVAAEDLGRRIAALGGVPAESAARRMLRHMTDLSTLDEPEGIAGALLVATLDLMDVDSAAVMRHGDDAILRAVASTGPLAYTLAGAPPADLEALAVAGPAGAARVAGDADGGFDELRAAGARTIVVVPLVAHAEVQGVLALAGASERAVSVDDLELLELLAAHAASCLRTADLMRSLRERAATDPLTGLGHHATFHETLAHAHRRPRTAVVLCDVDGFKRLNDTFGHQHGDHVLRSIASALTGALRRGDRLFRIGGDEFAALLVVADATEAREAGLRLRAAVAEAGLGVTVSVGVAVPQEGESDASLLARADRALYRVKAQGRDGVALAADEPLPIVPPM